ncbi:hypothetical protein OROMI_018613 [Orobanche minor]
MTPTCLIRDKVAAAFHIFKDTPSVPLEVIAKEKIVGVDEANKSITFELIDGEVMIYYTSKASKANLRLV